MNDFKEKILKHIQAGDITMIPRWQFVLKTVLLSVSVLIVALVAVYLLSFVFFALHKTGLWFAPALGWRGFVLFVVSSPWLLIGLVGLFVLLLYVLVTQYAFSYKKPLVYSLIGVVLVVIAVSSLIQQTMMHERVRVYVEEHNVPGVAPFYRMMIEERPREVTEGVITELTERGLLLQSDDDEDIEVVITDETRQPPGTQYAVGEYVLVFGEPEWGVIEAFGIRKVDEDAPMPPHGTERNRERMMQNPPAPPSQENGL